ncbi:MAG: peroxiredoxin-like family protein [Alphaproteobacteria bacterium]|nr:peroxiredoxin-like family protein [Alphaproteobacteria bacterium]
MSLAEQLEEFNKAGLARVPDEVRETLLKGNAEMIEWGLEKNALKTGDQVPDFELPNATGEKRRLSDLLAKGPVVISFYRGGWCPYCNLELKALQEKLPEITDLGASLVAVSPELPDNSLSTAEKNALSFDVLSDSGNEVARQFGLVFELPAVLKPLYEKMGLDLEKANGDDSFTLPIPATYVIDTDRTILGAYVDADYSKRMEPSDIVAALRRR